MSNKFLKNKTVESDEKNLKSLDSDDDNKIRLEDDDNPAFLEAFEKTIPFTAPILFDSNIWTDAFLEWVKRFNQEEYNKNSKDNTES